MIHIHHGQHHFRFRDKGDFKEAEHPRGTGSKGGQFVKKGTAGGTSIPSTGTSKTPKLTKTSERAWTGKSNTSVPRLSKQVAGRLGEEIALSYLTNLGVDDAQHLNTKAANFPVDLRGGDHVYEVKTGQVSNSASAAQWRATIGEPGKSETADLKSMSKEEKARHNQAKAAAIMRRKQQALDEVSNDVGRKLKPRTLTMILNPETGVADIFLFDGFHSRIGYNSPLAGDGYVGSYKYEGPAGGKSGDTRDKTRDHAGNRIVGERIHLGASQVLLWVHR